MEADEDLVNDEPPSRRQPPPWPRARSLRIGERQRRRRRRERQHAHKCRPRHSAHDPLRRRLGGWVGRGRRQYREGEALSSAMLVRGVDGLFCARGCNVLRHRVVLSCRYVHRKQANLIRMRSQKRKRMNAGREDTSENTGTTATRAGVGLVRRRGKDTVWARLLHVRPRPLACRPRPGL